MKIKAVLSTVVSFALLLSLLAVSAYAAESKFSDVPANAYYADAVAWAVERGITSGTSATTFSPDSTCTRAQILTFIWRANGSPEPDVEKISTANHNPFPDLNGTEYYFKAAQWAYTRGMVAGGMNFDGNAPCSRSLAVTYLWKEAGEPQPDKEAGFTDIIRALHNMNAISWAVEAGITSGTSATTFSPDTTCTRGQIVTFLYRAMGSGAGDNVRTDAQQAAEDWLRQQATGGSGFGEDGGFTDEEIADIASQLTGGGSGNSGNSGDFVPGPGMNRLPQTDWSDYVSSEGQQLTGEEREESWSHVGN